MTTPTISPAELANRSKLGSVELLDVRTPSEFEEVHVAFARNFPMDRLDPAAVADRSPETPLYIICRSGSRGQKACERLQAAGIANVVNVEGGTLACVEAGLPVVRGRKTISLERQVRIVAGLLVVLGLALGWFVHPAFLMLSAAVGAGLAHAGMTDSCVMGMLLSRMPWNQRAARSDGSCSA